MKLAYHVSLAGEMVFLLLLARLPHMLAVDSSRPFIRCSKRRSFEFSAKL